MSHLHSFTLPSEVADLNLLNIWTGIANARCAATPWPGYRVCTPPALSCYFSRSHLVFATDPLKKSGKRLSYPTSLAPTPGSSSSKQEIKLLSFEFDSRILLIVLSRYELVQLAGDTIGELEYLDSPTNNIVLSLRLQ